MAMNGAIELGRIVLVAAVVGLAGCGEPQPPTPPTAPPDLVWPQPPLAARIKFVGTLRTPADAGVRRGWFDNVVTFIRGVPKKRMSRPYGITKDADGRLYVVDTFHKAVQVFDERKAEHYWFPQEEIDDFDNPIGVAAGPGGRVYVSDSVAKVIHVFAEHGKTYLRAAGRGVLRRPTGLTVDQATGDILVTDTLNSQVVVIDAESLMAKKFVGRVGAADDAFHSPTGIAMGADRSVYVSDTLNYRVQVLSPDLGFRRRFGQPGDSPGHFSRPKGIAVDSDGHVYVVDALFDNVQIFDRMGRLLLAFGSPGSAPGEFWLPNDIYIDDNDRIYVADSYNQRLQVFQYLKQGGGQ